MNARLIFRAPLAALLLMAGVIAAPSLAHAQAKYTASYGASIFVFGGYNDSIPDFDHPHNNGLVFGADYTRYFGWKYHPSLEFRATYSNGPTVNEHTLMVGARVERHFGTRYNLYGDFLVGPGYIEYPVTQPYPPYTTTRVKDEGRAYSLGGGVDVELTRHFSAKADYQVQLWNLGKNLYTVPSGGDFTLSPKVLTLGVVYRIPFKPWISHGHETQ